MYILSVNEYWLLLIFCMGYRDTRLDKITTAAGEANSSLHNGSPIVNPFKSLDAMAL